MRSILLILLLLVPLTFPIIDLTAQAQSNPILEERGRDFERWSLPNGNERMVLGIPMWVENNGQFVKWYWDQDADTYTLANGRIGVEIFKSNGSARYWDSQITKFQEVPNPLFDPECDNIGGGCDPPTISEPIPPRVNAETWQVDYFATGVWNPIPLDFSDASFSIVETRDSLSLQITKTWANNVSVILLFSIGDGLPLKHTLTITSGLAVRAGSDEWRVWQIWDGIDADTIEDEEGIAPIVSREKTIRSDETVFNFYKEGKLRISEDQRGARHAIKSITTDPLTNSAKFLFENATMLSVRGGQSFVIDPETFTDATPSMDFQVRTDSTIADACGSTTFSKTNSTTFRAHVPDADLSEGCDREIVRWATTSIPDNAIITDTVLKYDLVSIVNLTAIAVEVRAIANDPDTSTAANLWTDAGDGTIYVAALSETAGDNISQDLGASADVDVQSNLAVDWFAISGLATDETRHHSGANTHTINDQGGTSPTPAPTLEVTYTLPELNIEVVANDGTTALSPALVIIGNRSGLFSNITSTTGWANFTGMTDADTVTIQVIYQNAKVNQTSSNFTITSAGDTLQAYAVSVYNSSSLSYHTQTNRASISPTNTLVQAYNSSARRSIFLTGSHTTAEYLYVNTNMFDGLTAVTAEGWVYGYSDALATNSAFISPQGNPIILHFRGPGFYTNLSNGTAAYLAWGTTPTYGVWHHLVGTWDGSTKRTYVDRVETNSVGWDGGGLGLTTASVRLEIGQKFNDGQDAFRGNIGPIRIYNRALSSAEITNNYRGQITTSGLLGWWEMSEGSGLNVLDYSGNGEHMFITNVSATNDNLYNTSVPIALAQEIFISSPSDLGPLIGNGTWTSVNATWEGINVNSNSSTFAFTADSQDQAFTLNVTRDSGGNILMGRENTTLTNYNFFTANNTMVMNMTDGSGGQVTRLLFLTDTYVRPDRRQLNNTGTVDDPGGMVSLTQFTDSYVIGGTGETQLFYFFTPTGGGGEGGGGVVPFLNILVPQIQIPDLDIAGTPINPLIIIVGVVILIGLLAVLVRPKSSKGSGGGRRIQ